MSSNNLGTKRVCPKCDAKFYDFGATDPIKCPKCAHSWKEGAKKKSPPAAKPAVASKPSKKPVRDEDKLLEMAGDLPEVEDGGEVEELEPMEDDGVELTSLEEVEEHEEEEEVDPNSDDAEDEMFTEMGGDKIVDDYDDHDDDDEENDEEDSDEDEDDDDGDGYEDRRKNRRKR